jgi:hypothetical protein
MSIQGNLKMKTNQYTLVLIILLLATVFSWGSGLDSKASDLIDHSLKRALTSFATARTLNAAISVAQDTQLSLQPMGVGVTLSPGQVLDAVNDLVEQFSNLMLIASVALGIQKVLLSMGSYWLFSCLLTVVAVAWSILAVLDKNQPKWLSQVLVISLLLRFSIPLTVVGTDWVFQQFLANSYAENQQQIRLASYKAEAFTVKEQSPPEPRSGSKEGWWVGLTDSIDESLSQAKKNLDLQSKFQKLQQQAEQWAIGIINLIVVFLLEVLLIPIVLLWIIFTVIRGFFLRN